VLDCDRVIFCIACTIFVRILRIHSWGMIEWLQIIICQLMCVFYRAYLSCGSCTHLLSTHRQLSYIDSTLDIRDALGGYFISLGISERFLLIYLFDIHHFLILLEWMIY